MHTCTLNLQIVQQLKTLVLQVTQLAGWELIVGKSWLRKYNPLIHWADNTVAFSSGYCMAHCLPTPAQDALQAPDLGAAAGPQNLPPVNQPSPQSTQRIAIVFRAGFEIAAAYQGSQLCVFALSLDPAEDDDACLEDTPVKLVPHEYHEFSLMFFEKEARNLPPHRYVDHEIPLMEGKKPQFGRMYSMSDAELKDVREWTTENLSKSFISASSYSAAFPILFVKKKDSPLRLCVDYRALNDITLKHRHPFPRIEETLNQIRGFKYFTRLDLQACFNQIRIKEGNEWKTAFTPDMCCSSSS